MFLTSQSVIPAIFSLPLSITSFLLSSSPWVYQKTIKQHHSLLPFPLSTLSLSLLHPFFPSFMHPSFSFSFAPHFILSFSDRTDPYFLSLQTLIVHQRRFSQSAKDGEKECDFFLLLQQFSPLLIWFFSPIRPDILPSTSLPILLYFVRTATECQNFSLSIFHPFHSKYRIIPFDNGYY